MIPPNQQRPPTFDEILDAVSNGRMSFRQAVLWQGKHDPSLDVRRISRLRTASAEFEAKQAEAK